MGRTHPFTDVEDGRYYSDAVEWAFRTGVTTGTSVNTFSPNLPVTRADLVTMLWRNAGSPAHVDPVPGPPPPPSPAPPAPSPAPIPTPSPSPPSRPPWTFPPGVEAMVSLPQGPLGPRWKRRVVPSAEIATKQGDTWTFHADYTDRGASLDLGACRINLNGFVVYDVYFTPLSGGGGVVRNGTLGFFECTNPDRQEVNLFKPGDFLTIFNGVAHDIAGDIFKSGNGDSLYVADVYASLAPIPSTSNTAKHNDGLQVFGDGYASMTRVVIDFQNAGEIAGTTGMIFTQQGASLYTRDITLLNPGGSWNAARLFGGGDHNNDRWHIVGERRPNVKQPDRLAPKVLIAKAGSVPKFTVFKDVDGVPTWEAAS